MHEFMLRVAAFGRIFLIADGIVFGCSLVYVFGSSLVYLLLQLIRKRNSGDQGYAVTTDETIARETVLESREDYVSMESLATGYASRQDWAMAIGFNVAFVSFVMMFLGLGLVYLPEGDGLPFSPLALVCICFPLVVAPLAIRMQYSDYKKMREKLSHDTK
jgi:hypothetical protein